MRRNLALLAAALLLAGAAPARAQTVLVPSDAANYHRKLDLASQDQEILLLPQSAFELDHGPYRLRFESAALDSLVQAPPTVSYLSVHEPGLLLQVLHLRAHEPDVGMLGPQHFVVEDVNGSVVGAGTLLVAGVAPEGLGLLTAEGDRSLELGRDADVRLRVRPHGNLTETITAGNERDFRLVSLQVEGMDSTGVLTLAARIRPLREGATELRLSAETVDGRNVPLVFPDLSVNAPAPRRVRVGGGPAYVDEAGRGIVKVSILDLPSNLPATPEVVRDAAGEMLVTEQHFDREHGTLTATLELTGRGSHPAAGSRDGREIRVRAGTRTFRGSLDVVGPPLASSVKVEGTDSSDRAVVPIGGRAVLRIAGKNLEGLHLDCSDLGEGSSCRTLGSASDELVAEVHTGSEIREGDQELVLRADPRPDGSTPDRRVPVRVRVEYPAIPAPLAGADFLGVPCPTDHGCHVSGDGQSMVVRSGLAGKLLLHFDDPAIPAEYGWQKLIVTVTRARGDQRQVVRTYGTPVSPRLVRNGSQGGDLPLLDPTLDPKHGDLFIVRVEHAADQYAPEYRTGLASAEAYVRRIYIDGGPAKRLSGDIVVQPVLFALGADSTGGMKALYPNAGLGMTWQFLNGRLEPRPYSVKLQALLTNLQSTGSGGLPGQPALFLSGNLRVPGSDPSRPLVLTTGVARTFGEEGRWQLLIGAGIDLGVANMIFGG
jgi:hypothetical protein